MSVLTHWTAGTVVAGDLILRPGTVSVDGAGRIAAVRPGPVEGARPLGDVLLVPGAVDLHSDAVAKLAEPRPGVRLPFGVAVRALDRRLAGAGVTTGYAALRLIGDEIGRREWSATEALWSELRALPDPLVDHRLHLRVELADEESVRAAEELLARGEVALLSVRNHTTVEHRLGRLSAAARGAGVPLAWHDPDSPQTIGRARAHGTVIAEFPTTVQTARAARPAGLAVAMGAPNLLLRRSTSGNLSAFDALSHRALHLLVGDYYPEALWPAALGCGLPLPAAVALVTRAPARAAGLTDRGVLAPGRRADLVAVRRDGTVVRTVVAGRVVA